jgi:selenide, water dikinase
MMAGLGAAAAAPGVLVGVETGDDAGVIRVRDDLALVVTADFITPVLDDPFRYGQVAAANSLSDVYAMGGTPTVALNLCAFPSALDPAVAREILEGGVSKCREAGAPILGGHTVRNEELLYGLAVTGTVHPDRVVRNVGGRAGEVVLLTKPLGTGLVINGARKGVVAAELLDRAVAQMTTLNRVAAATLARFAPTAMTDVTGFGLAGHGLGMVRPAGLGLRLEYARLPRYEETEALARAGVTTRSTRTNRESVGAEVRAAAGLQPGQVELVYDPQTSGGLLATVAAARAEECLRALHDAGVSAARIIGEVVATPGLELI